MSIEQRTWQLLYFFACLIIYGLLLRQFYTVDRPFFQWLVCKDAFVLMYGIVLNLRITSLVFWAIVLVIFLVVDLDKALDFSE